MLEMDFVLFRINNFSPHEIMRTGASLHDVKVETIHNLQKERELLNRRIGLIKNGLTTGVHKAKEHPNGNAVDYYLYSEDGEVNPNLVVESSLMSGFRGIGVYYNYETKLYSFHGDTRSHVKFWAGIKKRSSDSWAYLSLLVDPKEVG